ncbi:MAG: FAD-dependent protein [Syntrophaceae bacterium]
MQRFRITNIVLSLGESEGMLKEKIASLLNIPHESVSSLTVVRKSIDARRRKPPRFIYAIDFLVPDNIDLTGKECLKKDVLTEEQMPKYMPAKIKREIKPVIIGCGPAGLFAALTLAKMGNPPLVLERGKKVSERIIDVRKFWERGVLNTESNVHFGEGGAGTFSDGKLTSRVKNPYTAWVKTQLVDAGAPHEILTDTKPHIGTDRLREVVVNLRTKLTEMGCDFRFESKVTDFLVHQGKVEGVIVNEQEEIRTDCLILAAGQSAEDIYGRLYEHGVHLEPKPFAIGFRVEHPQELINSIQYGRWRGHPDLPPADYFLTTKIKNMNRSVYTFCMCPGGSVIGCSSETGSVVTNGMSHYRRDSHYANSAVVVAIHSEDFRGTQNLPISGLEFRRNWEKKAFILGGENYYAPAQRMVDFLRDRAGSLPTLSSFSPGVKSALLRDALPQFAVDAIKQGVIEFDRKMRGFITEDAILIGVETRTSSPVRIVRRPDGQSITITGLYPCGEGAGYAGGIISSALDGIRVAEKVAI